MARFPVRDFAVYAVFALVPASLAGCAEQPGAPLTSSHSALRVGLDLAGRSDVRQVRYEITPVDCASGESAGSLIVSERQVSGAVPSLESVGSDRVMAHAFTQLPTGCYDVTATPLTHRGEASAVCASASEALIEVQRGATTSVALVSHCSPHVRAFGEHALATSEG